MSTDFSRRYHSDLGVIQTEEEEEKISYRHYFMGNIVTKLDNDFGLLTYCQITFSPASLGAVIQFLILPNENEYNY